MALVLPGTTNGYALAPTQTYNGNSNYITIAFELYLPTSHGNAAADRIFELGGYNRGPETGAGGLHSGGITLSTGSSANKIQANVWETGGTTDFGDLTVPLDAWTLIVINDYNVTPASKLYIGSSATTATSASRTRQNSYDRFTIGALNDDATANLGKFSIRNLAIYDGVNWSDASVDLYEVGVTDLQEFNGDGQSLKDSLHGAGYWPLDYNSRHTGTSDTLTVGSAASFDESAPAGTSGSGRMMLRGLGSIGQGNGFGMSRF